MSFENPVSPGTSRTIIAGRRLQPLSVIAALGLFVLPAVSGCSKQEASNPPAAPAAAAEAPSQGSGPVIARVNGVDIRDSDLQVAEDDLGENLHNMDPAQKREQLIAYVTDVILISQAAEKQNLQNNEDFKRRLSFTRSKLLMGTLLTNQAKIAATDEEMKKVYEEAVKPMASEEEVRARHILVETEDEAKAIVEQLKGGADFAALAKEKSKDQGASDGGDLGYFVKGQMVPEFAEVAFKMYPGQLSNPVKTQFGWHVIKLEDKRPRQAPPFEVVKEQISAFVTRKSQSEFVAQLRQSAKIERLDKPATPAAGAPPAMLPPGAAKSAPPATPKVAPEPPK